MPIEIRGLAPLLGVFDMRRSVRFYRDVLGFELVSTSAPGDDFGWALLRRGGVELMLNILHGDGEGTPAPDPARTAAHGDTALSSAVQTWTARTRTFARTAWTRRSRSSRAMA